MLQFSIALLSLLMVSAVILVVKVRQFSTQKAQLYSLANQGIRTTGIVTKKRRYALGRISSRYLHYSFKASNGKRYRRAIEVSPFIWRCYDTGMPIDVVFLPHSPTINSVQYLVAEIKKMMTV